VEFFAGGPNVDAPIVAGASQSGAARSAKMDEGTLRDLAGEFLIPFFSGARLDSSSVWSSDREHLVALQDPLTIAFKVERSDSYRLVMRRSQPFANNGEVVVPEIDVVKALSTCLLQ
jgi:hypothetical protein